MILLRSFNIDDIKSVFTHPDIWETIAEDGQEPEDFKPDPNKDCYMACVVDGEIIGFYVLRPVNSVALDIHAQILPKHREKHALESGQKIIKWFSEECPRQYQKLVCDIPEIYPNVRKFCLKQGFADEGFSPKSYRKNGELWGRWFMGLERAS